MAHNKAAIFHRCNCASNFEDLEELPIIGRRQRTRSEEGTASSITPSKTAYLPRLSQNEDDSADSAVSGHFDKADFLPANWDSAAEFIRPVGFAVVGLAIVTHPFICLAGALTAFGTVQAAGTVYDFFSDGSICSVLAKTEAVEEGKEKHAAITKCVSEVSYTMCEEMEERLNETLEPLLLDEPKLNVTDPSTIKSTQKLLEWVRLYYPALHNTILDKKEFFGLNAKEFYEVFFANHAPYTFEAFQKKRLDKDIRYGRWETLEHVKQPSMHSHAPSCENLKVPDLRERILKFKAKTRNYFGPPYATTTKVQRALIVSKRLLVIESKTTLADIPFCDRFYVMERWIVTTEKRGNDDYCACLSVYAQVFFTKRCPFESQITTKSRETILEVANQWSEMADEALKRTEEARFLRIQKSFSQAEADCVEVRYNDVSQANVVREQPPVISRAKNSSSIGRMSRSISRYVRKRSSSLGNSSRSAHIRVTSA